LKYASKLASKKNSQKIDSFCVLNLKKSLVWHLKKKFLMHSWIFNIKTHFFVNLLEFWILHDLGNLLINNLEWKIFFIWFLCCYEVEWVLEIWSVMFLMVPPKNKFAQWVHGTRLREENLCCEKKKKTIVR